MFIKKYLSNYWGIAALGTLLTWQIACGEDPSLYSNESLSFENPKISGNENSSQDVLASEQKIDLGAEESSDFSLVGSYPWMPYPTAPFYDFPWAVGYPLVPYDLAPVYDYYLHPIPVAVPITPTAAAIEYVHPFYAYRAFNPWGGWDDYGDDDGDDDRGNHNNDNDEDEDNPTR